MLPQYILLLFLLFHIPIKTEDMQNQILQREVELNMQVSGGFLERNLCPLINDKELYSMNLFVVLLKK